MSAAKFVRRDSEGADRPDRAVVDIGSNTVRMVVYAGRRRAPIVWLNDKVTARLGRDLATTGLLPEEAMTMALAGLARFASILKDLEITEVQTVATAAAREARNGAAFLDQVRALGLDPLLLSGEEEAVIAASGVLGAFPGAEGVVADLGGGSLELVEIGQGRCGHGISLPLGTLRLPALRADGDAALRKAVNQELRSADWSAPHTGTMYMVGGTWRSMANFAMHKAKYPLTDPHAFSLSLEEADKVARKLSRMAPDQLSPISGISSSRAAGLPDAAAMLRTVLASLKPERIVFSSWGLREGLLYRQLQEAARQLDPFLVAVDHFTGPRGASANLAAMIAGWISPVAHGGGRAGEQLRLAAIMLALAQARLEPNMRLKHSFDWAMDKRWVGLDHRGRALLGAALRGACNKPEPTADLLRLASEEELADAAAWGLAIRLCRRLGAGSQVSLMTSRLERDGDVLTLWLDESRQQLASDSVESDLKNLAKWLGCTHAIRIGAPVAA